MSDSDGYLTVINKNFSLRSRIFSGSLVKQMVSILGKLALVHQDSIAFSSGADGKISPGFCESGMKSLTTGEHILGVSIENKAAKQPMLYALTSKANILVFKFGIPATGRDTNECEMKSII